jgi:hypothetical protein
MQPDPQTPHQIAAQADLDTLLRVALYGRPVKHTVWAFLNSNDPERPHHADPIRVTVEIVADENGALAWHPIGGRHIAENGGLGDKIDLDTVRGDRIWWGPWTRRFAQARLRVELERLDGADGDRRIRVLATFPPPRGYGEA